MSFSRGFSGFFAAGLAMVAAAQERTVWPSVECGAFAHKATEMRCDDSRVLHLKTGVKDRWPGVTVAFTNGVKDMTAFGRIRVGVSNETARPLEVHLSVKNNAQQGQSPGGSVRLAPNGAGEISVSLFNSPWVLDSPLELVGMRGCPTATGGGSFDVRKVSELHVFLSDPREPAAFSVSSIRLGAADGQVKKLSAAAFLPFVDRFGQFRHDDWPGKVHGEDELAKARDNEAAWLAKNADSPIAGADRFGGWAAGPQLKATGFFRTEKVEGKWWLVDPDGRLFFSQGVDCVRIGAETGVSWREKYFEWMPDKADATFKYCFSKSWWAPHGFYQGKGECTMFDFVRANMIRKYGPDYERTFRELAHKRIHAWGLNTIANWSDGSVYRQHRTPYTVCLGTEGPRIEGSVGWWGKFPDPYSQEFERGIARQVMNTSTNGADSDLWCIGYFVDNELSWGRDDRDLARATLASPATQPAKAAFKEWLAGKYADTAALNAVWGTSFADWGAFLASTNAVDEKKAGADLMAFHGEIAEKYYRTIRDAIKAVKPNRLYLGSRIAWGAPSVYRAAAKYCDVVSVNIYNRQPNRELPADAEDKPMINGEFHFGALDRGMFHTGLVPTKNQGERAACYKAFVTACLRNPRYVGTHWFQWRDQALTGRGDGENYQIGFLTVTDQPYPELVQAAREIAATMYVTRYEKTSAN